MCLVDDTVPVWAKAATARAAKSFIFSKISKLKNHISLFKFKTFSKFSKLFVKFLKIFLIFFENLPF